MGYKPLSETQKLYREFMSAGETALKLVFDAVFCLEYSLHTRQSLPSPGISESQLFWGACFFLQSLFFTSKLCLIPALQGRRA